MVSRDLDEFSAEVINFEHALDDAIKEAELRYDTGLNMARRYRVIEGELHLVSITECKEVIGSCSIDNRTLMTLSTGP